MDQRWHLAGRRLGFAAVFFLALPAAAMEQVVIAPNTTHRSLGRTLDYLEDADGAWSLDEVLAPSMTGRWQHSQQDEPGFGFTPSTYWFATSLISGDPVGGEWLLQVEFPEMDSLTLFVRRSGRTIHRFDTGDNLSFAQRPVAHRNFLFPIQLDGKEPTELYFRVQNEGSMQLPLSIWDEAAFAENDQRLLLNHGLYYGIVLVMVLYNLIIYVVIRERSYLLYVGFIGAVALFLASVQGLSFQYLWPESVWWNSTTIALFIGVALAAAPLFCNEYLHLNTRNQGIARVMNAMAACAVGVTILSLIMSVRIVIVVESLLAFVLIILALTVGILRWRAGDPAARYFVIAFVSFMLGTVLFALNKLGVLERNFITENGIQIGSGLQIVLLSLGLAVRMSVIEQEKFEAERQNMALKQSLHAELQSKVHIFANIAHEINNPLNYILTGMANLKDVLDSVTATCALIFAGSEDSPEAMAIKGRLDGDFEQVDDIFRGVETGVKRCSDVVAEMRGLAEVDGKLIKSCPMEQLMGAAMQRLAENLPKGVLDAARIDHSGAPQVKDGKAEHVVEGNPYFLIHSLFSVLAQIHHFARQGEENILKVRQEQTEFFVVLTLTCAGSSLTPEQRDELFDPEAPAVASSGANMAVVRLLLRQQGGDLSLLDDGSESHCMRFEVRLARRQNEDESEAVGSLVDTALS